MVRRALGFVIAFSLGVGCATAPASDSRPTTPARLPETSSAPPTTPAPLPETGSTPPTTPAPPKEGAPAAWPPLPTDFVSGRLATLADVGSGRAVFAMQGSGLPPGEAIAIPLPQYAYCAPGGGTSIPGVIVQAERAGGMEFVGFRPVAGNAYVTLLMRCRLLGQSPPTE